MTAALPPRGRERVESCDFFVFRPLELDFTYMRTYLLLIALGAALTAGARELSPEEAYARMRGVPGLKGAPATVAPQVLHAEKGVYYVFGRAGEAGYAIASADDRARPLLGYSDSGTFDAGAMPPQMRWWLDNYRAELAASASDVPAATVTDNYSVWTPVTPLVTSKWDQMEPYWNLCPAQRDERCVTGCVATAMAQIINFHRYFRGAGIKTYNPGFASDLTMDFSQIQIDFALLRDTYDTTASEEEKAEVAKLMLACGISVEMDYGTSVSGAMSEKVPGALATYMGYDAKSTYQLERTAYSTPEWESLIYDELKAGRPLYYSGTAVGGGHAFVCDGYDRDGLFHFNWGWSGMSDGYFALSALSPSSQGAGSYEGGYNANQAVVLIRPQMPEGEVSPFDIRGGISLRNGRITFRYSPGVINENVMAELGYSVCNASGDIVKEAKLHEYNFIRPANTTADTRADEFSDITESGSYTVYPVWRRQGDEDWQRTSRLQRYAPALTFDVADRAAVNFAEQYPKWDLQLYGANDVNLGAASPKLSFTVVNNGETEFNEPAGISLCDKEGNLAYRLHLDGWPCSNTGQFNYTVVVPSGGNRALSIPLSADNVEAGDYTLHLTDCRREIISAGIPVKLRNFHESVEDYGDVNVLNINDMPDIIVAGEPLAWQVRVNFRQSLDFYPGYRFYLPDTDQMVWQSETTAAERMEPYTYLHYPLPSVTPELKFGLYDVVITDGDRQVSPRHRVRFSGKAGGICYIPGQIYREAEVCAGGDYQGDLSIPAETEIEGTLYYVSAVAENAFKHCSGLTSVTLPPSVVTVGRSAFDGCYALRAIMAGCVTAPWPDILYSAPGLDPELAVYVPAAAYDVYAPAHRAYRLYAAIQSLEQPQTVQVEANHETQIRIAVTPADKPVEPRFAVTPASDIASVGTEGVWENGQITLTVKGLRPGQETFILTSAQPGVAPLNLTVDVAEDSGIGSVKAENGDTLWWTIDGLQLRRKPETPGIYITVRDGRRVRTVVR